MHWSCSANTKLWRRSKSTTSTMKILYIRKSTIPSLSPLRASPKIRSICTWSWNLSMVGSCLPIWEMWSLLQLIKPDSMLPPWHHVSNISTAKISSSETSNPKIYWLEMTDISNWLISALRSSLQKAEHSPSVELRSILHLRWFWTRGMEKQSIGGLLVSSSMRCMQESTPLTMMIPWESTRTFFGEKFHSLQLSTRTQNLLWNICLWQTFPNVMEIWKMVIFCLFRSQRYQEASLVQQLQLGRPLEEKNQGCLCADS